MMTMAATRAPMIATKMVSVQADRVWISVSAAAVGTVRTRYHGARASLRPVVSTSTPA
jgi:hypothetical protein